MFQKSNDENQKIVEEQSSNESSQIMHQKPLMCLIDLDEKISKSFTNQSYRCIEGTIGSYVRVPNKRRGEHTLLTLNYSVPSDLHEYDIVVLDMNTETEVEYNRNYCNLENISGNSAYALSSEFPETVFNPRPYATKILSEDIDFLLKKESIIIIFAGRKEVIKYQEVQITPLGNQKTNSIEMSNTELYDKFPYCFNKTGQKFKLLDKQIPLMATLAKYISQSHYELVFSHPKFWNGRKQEEDPSFVPLLLNDDDEVVSYYHTHGNNSVVFVFPQISNKEDFLLELLNCLAEMFPNIFPCHGQFSWLDNGEYPLPSEIELKNKRERIEQEYLADISAISQEFTKIKSKYQFLRDLISESSDKLVKSVEYYFKWLGFSLVINCDETNPEVREEDLQVDCGNRFLVVEIKGIGGTSTDNDCSQISKIKFRRAEQRERFDVFGLYIVNHQRYLPPENRLHTPFSDNQIKDAVLDKRGLLTTYELFKAYFLIEKGILKKEDVQNQLFGTGLITLQPPNLKSIGIPIKFFQHGQIAILNLDGEIALKEGDTVIVRKGNSLDKLNILSLQKDDIDVEEADLGEVGIKFDKRIKENSELYVEQR